MSTSSPPVRLSLNIIKDHFGSIVEVIHAPRYHVCQWHHAHASILQDVAHILVSEGKQPLGLIIRGAIARNSTIKSMEVKNSLLILIQACVDLFIFDFKINK